MRSSHQQCSEKAIKVPEFESLCPAIFGSTVGGCALLKYYAITIRNCIGLLLISRSMKYSLPAEICCFIKCMPAPPGLLAGRNRPLPKPCHIQILQLGIGFLHLASSSREYENNDMASKFQRAVTIILMLLLL